MVKDTLAMFWTGKKEDQRRPLRMALPIGIKVIKDSSADLREKWQL
jgi:hypothetical protein